jgi:uncharacterized membrane protein (DUF373 family)
LFQIAETAFYYAAGIVLVFTAAFSFYFIMESVIQFFTVTNDRMNTLVEIIDRVMLSLMIIEILHTVRASLQRHSLSAEPFLIVGLIAAVRRILIISVESGHVAFKNPEVFRNLLAEIGILGLLVLFFVISIWLIRRRASTETSAGTAFADSN